METPGAGEDTRGIAHALTTRGVELAILSFLSGVANTTRQTEECSDVAGD
jgi:hypothetical protein